MGENEVLSIIERSLYSLWASVRDCWQMCRATGGVRAQVRYGEFFCFLDGTSVRTRGLGNVKRKIFNLSSFGRFGNSVNLRSVGVETWRACDWEWLEYRSCSRTFIRTSWSERLTPPCSLTLSSPVWGWKTKACRGSQGLCLARRPSILCS